MSDMTETFQIKFPGDFDYIPAIRKFVSELLAANNFTPKFAYRSEIIIDELCNNAVSYGCRNQHTAIEVHFNVSDDRIEFVVKDEGGKKEDIEKLNRSVQVDSSAPSTVELPKINSSGPLGLELVRMLSDEIKLDIGNDNLTSIRVVKMREETPDHATAQR